MKGHFEGGILGNHTFCWTFTPTHKGEPAIVLPVYEHGRLVDLLAIARHEYRIGDASPAPVNTSGRLPILCTYTTRLTVGSLAIATASCRLQKLSYP
jgi:hypothetical protein